MMDANPRVALIQSPPMLVGGQSLFARSQQFASWIYGRLYSTGFARLQGADGNYWGHNAIIRLRPFMQNCGLPILPGKPPLGGEIMSHDFVEAALLQRAGWEVRMASDLGGSYETTPPTLIDHLKRDRRWCQGNLQHIKVLFAQGLRLPSRLHMAFGVMSYLSSPLWLLLIILFSADAIRLQQAPPVTYVGRYPVLAWPISHAAAFISVFVATLVLLYGPKVMALIVMLRDRRMTAYFGGRRRLILSAILEMILSTLLAPVFMLSHSWFVFNILIGRNAKWGAQLRGGDGISIWTAIRAFAPHTVMAIVAGWLAWQWTPADFWWYVPLLAGLAGAVLLAWFTSSPKRGAAARRRGLFLVPSELGAVPIVDHVDALIADRDPIGHSSNKDVAGRGGALQPA
jgi:membrane glycosyltransferase